MREEEKKTERCYDEKKSSMLFSFAIFFLGENTTKEPRQPKREKNSPESPICLFSFLLSLILFFMISV